MSRRRIRRSSTGEPLFRTSEVARILRVHPNTIRKYEEWNLIPPVPRTGSGYRIFTGEVLDILKIVRRCFAFRWVPGPVKTASFELLALVKDGRFTEAPAAAGKVYTALFSEHDGAGKAVEFVRAWIARRETGSPPNCYSRKQAALVLAVTPECLRTWERNGLIEIPRDPGNHYRIYGPEEMDRLLVIRSLRKAGCSQQAILRMFTRLRHEGAGADIVAALNTPTEPEDLLCATNYWLVTLETMLGKAERMMNLTLALSKKYRNRTI